MKDYWGDIEPGIIGLGSKIVASGKLIKVTPAKVKHYIQFDFEISSFFSWYAIYQTSCWKNWKRNLKLLNPNRPS